MDGSGLRRDLIGGVSTSVVALPLAIAFGVLAYAPLGEAHLAEGALAGLYGVIVAGLLASLFGGTPGQITVPTAPMSVMVTSILAALLKRPEIQARGEDQVSVLLALVALTIFLAGLLQWTFAAIGGGRLIKYIPYPVIAGFMNGVAITVFLGQLPPLLGAPQGSGLGALGETVVRPESVIVGVATVAAMLFGRRYLRKIPGAVVGLPAGMAVYFLIGLLGRRELLELSGNSLVIGPIPAALPTLERGASVLRLVPELPLSVLAQLLVPAVTLSVVASVDSLLTSVVSDMTTGAKHGSTRELFGQGLANVAAASVGALPVAASTVATTVNLRSGARSRLSGVVTSLSVLAITLYLGAVVQWIPVAALAGMLLYTAVTMVETEGILLSLKRSTVPNLLVIAAVAGITVAVDLIVGMAVGLIITTLLFVKQEISVRIVRRTLSGDRVHSRRVRSERAMRVLAGAGASIRVYELSGSLFFGACDQLLEELDAVQDCHWIILDFQRVQVIDLTGARLLRQLVVRSWDREYELLICGLEAADDADKARMRQLLDDVGVLRLIRDQRFRNRDQALEWAENALLVRDSHLTVPGERQLTLPALAVFETFTPEELEVVERYVEPRTYRSSEVIFLEGDACDGMYFVLSGAVSVLAGSGKDEQERRIATFGEDVFFGEMGLLEDKPRSATVRADTETQVAFLSTEHFRRLLEDDSPVASRVLLGIARALAERLRLTGVEVRTLEE